MCFGDVCAQIPCAVGTAAREERVQSTLDKLGLSEYFEAVVTAEVSPSFRWFCVEAGYAMNVSSRPVRMTFSGQDDILVSVGYFTIARRI